MLAVRLFIDCGSEDYRFQRTDILLRLVIVCTYFYMTRKNYCIYICGQSGKVVIAVYGTHSFTQRA